MKEVLQTFAHLQNEFPGAQILASSFDMFVTELEKVKGNLPVIEDEIGDHWIHGVQSDPLKVAQFRAIMRARKACLDSGTCRPTDDFFKKFDRLMLKIGEHTWGCDVKTFLGDWYECMLLFDSVFFIQISKIFRKNWANADFEKARSGDNYKVMENSWKEQRAYITNAIQLVFPFLN